MDSQECSQVISSNWVDRGKQNAVGEVLSNIKACGFGLNIWNINNIRELKDAISTKKRQLQEAYNNLRQGSWKRIQTIES